MRHHSFNEWLRKFAYPRLGRAKFPELIDLLRPFAPLEVTPEMILDCRFSRSPSFTHRASAVLKPPLPGCCKAPIEHFRFPPPPERLRSRDYFYFRAHAPAL